jgi:hypothetical protein
MLSAGVAPQHDENVRCYAARNFLYNIKLATCKIHTTLKQRTPHSVSRALPNSKTTANGTIHMANELEYVLRRYACRRCAQSAIAMAAEIMSAMLENICLLMETVERPIDYCNSALHDSQSHRRSDGVASTLSWQVACPLPCHQALLRKPDVNHLLHPPSRPHFTA